MHTHLRQLICHVVITCLRLMIFFGNFSSISGGDQMTASRVRGSKRIRSNAERGKEQLGGFVAGVEDWHAKVCLLGVGQLSS